MKQFKLSTLMAFVVWSAAFLPSLGIVTNGVAKGRGPGIFDYREGIDRFGVGISNVPENPVVYVPVLVSMAIAAGALDAAALAVGWLVVSIVREELERKDSTP